MFSNVKCKTWNWHAQKTKRIKVTFHNCLSEITRKTSNIWRETFPFKKRVMYISLSLLPGFALTSSFIKIIKSDNEANRIYFKLEHYDLTTKPAPLFILASSIPRREIRESWITKASKGIIIAVKVSERKASQRQREVFW